MRKIFGTDGARGVANIELTPELAMKIGLAVGFKLGMDSPILIGEDTRISSPMLRCAVASGISSTGTSVSLAYTIPTPAVSLLTREKNFSAGIVVSASHNPIEYNGIKVFAKNGFKLEDSEEEEIESVLEGSLALPRGINLGKIEESEHLKEFYIETLEKWFPLNLSGIKIAVDTAFGATYYTTPETLRRLRADLVCFGNSADGSRINVNCGSTHPGIISELVKNHNASLGISHDGDGDRVIFADENGEIVDGDETMLIISRYLKSKGLLKNNTVVGTVMTNMGVENAFNESGINFIRTKVGDRYVVSEMLKTGAVLGGEQSGHIIFLEKSSTGDGLITALLILSVLIEKNKPLSEIRKGIVHFPQILVNVRVKDKSVIEDSSFKKLVEEEDKLLKGKGRILIRPSGTEPLIRIMIEGENKEIIEKIALKIKEYLEV